MAEQLMDFRSERSPERGTSAVIRRVPIGIIGGNENSFRPIVLARVRRELIEKSPELKKFEPELLSQIRCFYPADVRARGQIDFEEMIYRDVFFVVFVVYLYEKEVLGHLDSTNWTRYLVDYIYPGDDGFVLYSAKELLMRGIKLLRLCQRKELDFGWWCEFCWKTATLALPRLSICEHFKHTFLNMAGYEPLAFVTIVKLPNFFACTEDCFRTPRV
ncbi:hypothetical protein AAG906_018407 [Vitis piasezkii]